MFASMVANINPLTDAVLVAVLTNTDANIKSFAQDMRSNAIRSPSSGGAPRKTGTMARSHSVIKIGRTGYWVATVGLNYPIHVHRGAKGRQPNPWLTRAFAKTRQSYITTRGKWKKV